MSIASPLTADSVITIATQGNTTHLNNEKLINIEYGIFEKDIVHISRLGLEKLQKEKHVETSRAIEGIANEVIRISSTIGQAKSIGNLTNNQATNLYNKIASLL